MKQNSEGEIIKNRYYKGKQLRSEDFIMEQTYFETLYHRGMMHTVGKGILHGLDLRQHKDKQFLLCAGSGVDEKGNILCVERDCEISLQEVEGFDTIKKDQAHVYLQERREDCSATFCAMSEQENHVEMNYTKHSWKLQVRSERKLPYTEFFDRYILYEDDDVCITQILPSLFPRKGNFTMRIEIDKKRLLSSLSYSYELNSYDFVSPHIKIEDRISNQKSRIEQHYINLQRKDTFANVESHVTLSEYISIQKEGKTITVPLLYEKEFKIYENLVDEITRRCIFSTYNSSEEGIYLGSLYLQEGNQTWGIAAITTVDIVDYLQPLYVSKMKEYILSLYRYECNCMECMPQPQASENNESHSGIVCLQDMQKLQDGYISERIDHGYQTSEVMIDVALRIQEPKEKQAIIIQGDGQLFPSQKKKATQIATQVFLQDGTFQIAIKSQFPASTTFVLWQASKIQRTITIQKAMQFIRLEPSMVEIEPLHTCIFTPVFDRIEHICECRFTLANKESGTIGDDGSYCAPANEGVYQVQATSANGEVVYGYVKVRNPAP